MAHLEQNTLLLVTETFSKAVRACFASLGEDYSPTVKPTGNAKHGDYQCNDAMMLKKRLQGTPDACEPKAAAEKIMQALRDGHDGSVIDTSRISMTGPGIVNAFLSDDYLKAYVTSLQLKGILPPVHPRRRAVMDYSSPNIAKEMHVGHLRSTILGDSLARLLEFCGHEVVRLNHVGDWGTQFGMLIRYIKQFKPDMVSYDPEADAGKLSVSELMDFYKASKKVFDKDADFKKASQEEVVALQAGEATNVRLWRLICAVSERAFSEVYDLLNIRGLVVRGESFYNPKLEATVQELIDKGVAEESKGAWIVQVPGTCAPMMVKKSDGGFNYSSTDMAAVRQRIEEEKGDWLIYITDAGQAEHFKQVFWAAQQVGWWDPQKVRIDHVPFGLVCGPDGKRFKSRSGDTVKLIDLINEAITRARAVLDEKMAQKEDSSLSEAEMAAIAHTVGVGAIKYFDLRGHRTSNYEFSYEKMLALNGNTAVYLLYAYVRIRSICRKYEATGKTMSEARAAFAANPSQLSLSHNSEKDLLRVLMRLQETLDLCTHTLTMHLLADYLYKLSTEFAKFHRDCQVLGSEQELGRLIMCDTVAEVMKKSLELLGLSVPERM